MATERTLRVFIYAAWTYAFFEVLSVIAWVLGFVGIAGLASELSKLAFLFSLISGGVSLIVWLATSKKE